MDHVFNTVKPQYVRGLNPLHLVPNSDLREAIRTETQFFNASPSFVQSFGSRAQMTRKVLRIFRNEIVTDEDDYHSLLVNSYCHKLATEGMYPAVPGWHCDYSKQVDEEERTTLEEDQDVRHWVVIMGVNNPPTYQFIDKYGIHVDDIKLPEQSWRAVSSVIDRKVRSGWSTKIAKPNEILEFRGNELYRHLPSEGWCWRIQIKVTLYPKGHKYRPPGTQGKERELQMVYMDCDGYW